MPYTAYEEANFGPGFTGLGTVGYQLFNPNGSANGSRITTGVIERGAGSGVYGALITIPDGFIGELRWSTDNTQVDTASTTINPRTDENGDVKTSSVGGLGAGSVSKQIVIDDGVNPLDGADVRITTDIIGANTIARGITNDSGIVNFMLDPGTYYCWAQLAGYSMGPQTLTVP